MEKIKILGVNISKLTGDAAKTIGGLLEDGRKHLVVTVNPEMLLAAAKDEEFYYILNRADLALADGVGLVFAAWAMGKNIKRITGADLVKDVFKLAEEKKLKVSILNWEKSLSKNNDIEKTLKDRYGKLAFEVITVNRDHNKMDKEASGEIIFTNLGAPFQEKLIYHHLKNWKNARLAIGVGGALDFLTGKIKRAPKIMRLLGLEWLWRLAIEPKARFRRIINAVIVFPFRFVVWRFVNPFRYRPNVACLAYKKENGGYKIMIVERTGEPGHWQLPQGGIDNMKIENAALKELYEEMGSEKFKVNKIYKNIYRYKFGQRKEEPKEYALMSQKHRGHKGQSQSLAVAEFIGSDSDIKINYWDHSAWKWVSPEKLVKEVFISRREATGIFLEKFRETAK